MNETHVYELDTEDLIVALREALEGRGYEITEQAPVGVWFLRANRDRTEAGADLMQTLDALLEERLREVQQDP